MYSDNPELEKLAKQMRDLHVEVGRLQGMIDGMLLRLGGVDACIDRLLQTSGGRRGKAAPK